VKDLKLRDDLKKVQSEKDINEMQFGDSIKDLPLIKDYKSNLRDSISRIMARNMSHNL
jgi:cell fate (sporulation/competence/biofilm development) regulator YmcA (YheA/YmcA/DUF963 family)